MAQSRFLNGVAAGRRAPTASPVRAFFRFGVASSASDFLRSVRAESEYPSAAEYICFNFIVSLRISVSADNRSANTYETFGRVEINLFGNTLYLYIGIRTSLTQICDRKIKQNARKILQLN